MSLALNDLLICCRHLEHERATERRKEVEKFKRLIRDPETIQQLDRHSDSKQGKYLNWDAVFRFLQKYIQKETECQRTAKPNVSVSTQASRQKKMQELSSLVKYFIKCANKRAPRLKCQELLSYIMETVKDSSNGSTYGADCSNILLKDILSVRKYWCEISQQQWLELFSVYFTLYLKPSQDINRVLVARIIHAVTKGCCLQTDGLNSKYLDFFSKAVQYARQEKSSAGLSHILAALNIFLKTLAVNFRIRACELGDEILPALLYIWAQHRLNDSLKEIIVELFQLQIYIHHPKGARTQEKGAYISAKWQSILYNIYDLIVNEISHIGSRGKYTSGSRNIAVKENLIELMADICHQVFNEDTRSLEISQSYTITQRVSSDQSAPCKRRKIELGWEVIKDHLQKPQNDFDLVPWLQITTQLVSKYPSSLPDHDLSSLLMILYQLLSQRRRGERTPYVLRCLMEVALCQGKKSNLETSQQSDLLKLWVKICTVTFRGISSEQTQAENFGLLGAIIQGSLVEIDREFWKLFTGSACRPSCSSVCCLALAMRSCIIPEAIHTGLELSICEVNGSFSLKELIMRWILRYRLEDDLEDRTELSPILHRNFPHFILEKILVSLTMKDCKAAMNFFQSGQECEHQKVKEEPSFSEIEELFLQTTFDKMDFLTSVRDCAVEMRHAHMVFSVHQNLKDSLSRYLLELSEQLLSNYSSEITNSETLVRCSSLLVGVLGCYSYLGVIAEEEACKSELFHKAKSLMQCAGESITLFKNKTNEDSRIGSLRSMMHLCTSYLCNCIKQNPSKIISGFFLRLLTSKLVNDIADICKNLASLMKKPFDCREMESEEDDSSECLMEVEGPSSMSLFSDPPADSVGDTSELGENQSTIGAMNPLAEEYLSKQDLLLLDMLRFLCMCLTASQASTVSFRAADIRRKLLTLVDSSILDPAKSVHLHMYLVLLKELPRGEYPLPMEDVVELLKPLSNVCSLYRRDQDVCKTILNHVLPVVANLGQGSLDAEATRDAQGQFLTVVGAFWHLAREKKCTFSVRAALVKCLKTLLEADPYSKWAILNVMGKDFPVNEVFPQFLADNHHQVRMLAAESINRLFQDMKQEDSPGLLKALPLKLQQTAFENAYLKAQEGMKGLSHSAVNSEVLDEIHGRKSVLLVVIAVVLCCSPVCEKQALFALCKSVKENGLETHLVKKVLEKVSETFGYRNLEDFMASHLDYLILEWLNCQNAEYSLSSFPYILLNYRNVEDFYRSCYKILIPHLVIRSHFDEVKAIANQIQEDWKSLLIDCFPKILVNILPYFAYEGTADGGMAQQRETAAAVYDTLKSESFLGKQIDHLFISNLPEIVVELLMTLHEPANFDTKQSTDPCDFSGDLDPPPNPPHFPSHVIKATFAYISNCHKTKFKSILEVLSKSPDSYQKILLAICEQAAETNNMYKKHRILKIYHLFVSLLLKDIKSGLGGAWAFVLRDVIYTLIHYINKRSSRFMDVSLRSFSLCCDLLNQVCQTAVTYCRDALENHLHVIVGTLTPLVHDQVAVQEQVLNLLKYLVIDNKDNENLYLTIKLLDPFPDHVLFKDLRVTQQKIKYNRGPFSLSEEINHFLSVSVYDALPLTRLEGLKDLQRQLAQHKDQMMDLVRASQENPKDGIMVKLIVNLLQLSKMAVNRTGERQVLEAVGSCLGELGPINFSTIAIQHNKDASYTKAFELLEDKDLRWTLIMVTHLNNTLVEDCVRVRSAAATCLKNILATKTGHSFWEVYKTTTDPMLAYIQPFRTSRKKFLEVPRPERESPLEGLDDMSLWIPQNENHDIWIKTLTCALLDSGGTKSEILQLLKPMCEVKADFCQTLLPYLIHDILLQDTNESWRNLLSTHVQGFFTSCLKHISQNSRSTTPANLDSDPEHFFRCCLDKKSQRTMLAVVDHMRRQKRPSRGTVFDDAFWLDLNYLEVAKVAQSCAAHFTALLYAEIYADKKSVDDQEKRTSTNITFEEGSQNTAISSLSEKSREETGISLQDLLLEIYRSIGEPDSLYGCGGGKMLQPLTRLRTYEHEAMWGKALVTYDLETAICPSTRQAGIIQALQNLGLCHILSIYLKGLDHENKESCTELQELHYQAAWRNMQWDLSTSVSNGMEGTSYHESLYNALQSLRDKEFSTFYESLKCARVKEVEELCKGSLESVYSVYPTLSRLQALGELENVGELFSRSVMERQFSEVYVKWQKHSQLLKDSDFSFQEPIMALRTVILEILMEKEMENSKRECLKDILTKHLVEFSVLARTFKNTQLPEKAIFQIKQYNSVSHEVSGWQLEEAQVFWAKKEQSLALSILKQMIKKLDASYSKNDPSLRIIHTECLRVCGNWLAETCLENPTVIMQTYLEKAVEVAGSCDGESSDELRNGKMKAFLSLARFSDNQYQRIENYMKSSEFENKQALLKRAKEEVGLLREHRIQTTRYTIKVQRELELDECALRALQEDRKRFLCKAVENYINCLLSGEEHDMWVFRLCSLWLENSGVPEVNGMMMEHGMKIPSYKFLPLMYQLAARMGTKMMGGLGFHEVLNNLISRISMDHPHHTLFIILALANANKDEFLTKPEAARRSRIIKNAPKQSSQQDEDRMEAANKIIHTIRRKRSQMVKNIEALCDAYILLANLDATQWKAQRKGICIPADQPITKLKNLEAVVVPTMEIKVDPTGKYENLVTIQSFKAEFRLAGGVNLPKIIDCVGSDGRERRQLVKGRDDLRQDAVMQQVFQMCNMLLQRNSETRKRKLTICTYKVVPLSQRSGVLEWCTGTIPLGEFLINGESNAHERYRPKDFRPMECQRKMMDIQKESFEKKYKTFMKICQHFQPVFRYFCMEKFLDPAVWFEKRLAYTRSVATSSIVGYILGLGDRHVQNILINEQSAELVHIDLGVAFEQGKILPTPETVPFRLTRDIVDGMGITGVEGVFRRCCEKTLEVMRNSKDTLLTIVEVLLYDPLFDWTMNPLKALYLQQRPEDETEFQPTPNADGQECKRNLSDIDDTLNKVAERVLIRLQEKLKGVEEGTVLSVGGQVNLLIQQAMDPKNLSRLFPGWKAWV
ncbi:serine-protein kinase ATM [Ochotona princeps]|uniref:serine-protein kinase ATM n=1 Tax=Ochotona princeps TaxID=9978 RepID=UPI00271483F1|nr:serine-protein kinase ATM [Ochotona princeps]XP_058519932.1 serine-protein kinase ATM [Ochotona princeps]